MWSAAQRGTLALVGRYAWVPRRDAQAYRPGASRYTERASQLTSRKVKLMLLLLVPSACTTATSTVPEP